MSELPDLTVEKRELAEIGAYFHQRGWSVGTSSNYSAVLNRDPFQLLVTASGKDKGRLTDDDFVVVDADGTPVGEGQPKSSAETQLHIVAAQQPGVEVILHTHSVWATLLSDFYFDNGGLEIEGYEMLKGLAGVPTHAYRAWIYIFENTQHIPVLARAVRDRLRDPDRPLKHGYLIRRHGLYTWGESFDEARRHVEVFEFLLECVAQRLMIAGALPRAMA